MSGVIRKTDSAVHLPNGIGKRPASWHEQESSMSGHGTDNADTPSRVLACPNKPPPTFTTVSPDIDGKGL